jgi:uncharacterized coiled-coil DUF342 family protein
MEDRELIWVPKKLKEDWELAFSEEEKIKVFYKAIEDKKIDIKTEIESLEEQVLIFKGIGLKYKNELEKVYNEQSQYIEKIWSEFNVGDKIYKQAKKINNDLAPISEAISNINSNLKGLSIYKVQDLIDLIEKFNSMSDKDKQLFKLLIDKEKED